MLQLMYLLCFFEGSGKKEVCPAVQEIKINPVKHASFVNHLFSVPPVENVHNVTQYLPMGVLGNIHPGCKPQSWRPS